ncbi:hypothetical protein [Avibacterium paragallinarum]|uniref:Uncharacterized protein n=1 Tax=Avibacterium paragallinarum TaxID=728 RepID=A0A377IUI7_AVIPA|nr:hypothetical protein [Avibacterium paragallinarum]POY47758.1 hypothetical protein C3364_00290 [Avibacterium paragallinarum]RZN73317.1 hypothetical protein EC523_13725 [Avibacterium paragallinarum]STO91924.1 Uncharacterised protein [Avibacterium paragallinarum]
MKKNSHTRCIRNFLLGFGSVLNIAPVVSASSTIDTDSNEYQYFDNAWKETGQYLREALEKREGL